MARPGENPRNPPRPPNAGCPQNDAAHSCFFCHASWRCPKCKWPLVADPEGGGRACPHCAGTVLTGREWDVVARTGLLPTTPAAGPDPEQGALDDAMFTVATRLVAARAAHARAASDLDHARTAHAAALKAMHDAEQDLLRHFNLDPNGDL